MNTYEVDFKGRRLHVEAVVALDRIEVFSYRLHGQPGREAARTDASTPCLLVDCPATTSKSEHWHALSDWSRADRVALYEALRVCAGLTR